MQKTIKLECAVENHGQEVSEVVFRAPRVRDLKAVGHIKDEVAQEAQLFANLCDLSLEAVEAMLLSDYAQLQQAWTELSGPKEPTSARPV